MQHCGDRDLDQNHEQPNNTQDLIHNQEHPNNTQDLINQANQQEQRGGKRTFLKNMIDNLTFGPKDGDEKGFTALPWSEIQRAVIVMLVAILIGVMVYSDKSTSCELIKKDHDVCELSKQEWARRAKACDENFNFCKKNMNHQEKESLKKIHQLELKNMEDQIMTTTELEREKVQDVLVENAIVWEEKVRLEKTLQELDRLRRKLREMGRIKCRDGFWSDGEEKKTILQQQDQVRGFATEVELVKGLGILKGLEDLFDEPCSLNERLIETQLLVWEAKASERMWHDIYHRSKVKQLSNDTVLDKEAE
ncbi:uncharacterized protein [Ptychodera flava]|uniref:uncharacterized protein n=1 Tax=Ptychodera flava TaxID=63121 RepID=UPI003969BD73